MKINKITDDNFRKYGKIVTGINLSAVCKAMEETPCPEDVVYVPSLASLEASPEAADLKNSVYGGQEIQIGYCNGHNLLLNAVEYYRDSELDIAVTDLVLMLGSLQDVKEDFTYDTSLVEAFLVPAGTAVELYATTLHYAPCHVDDGGFRCVVVLPKGTNEDLKVKPDVTAEDRLLFAQNKWLIAHEDAGLRDAGAFEGLKGKNISL